jgi:deoxycytidylate deaminase
VSSVQQISLVSDQDNVSKRPKDVIDERKSKELVIAFSGPIGCGISYVKEKVKEQLVSAGYVVHIIKISDYLKECINEGLVRGVPNQILSGADRYIQMQDAGNYLRSIQNDFLAEYSIKRIAEIRTANIPPNIEQVIDYVPSRTAYLIDQLKHPSEVQLLRAVYGNLFYLFGVLSTSSKREARLAAEKIPSSRISELVERDRKQPDKHGQQLDKSLQLADFFIRNDHANADSIAFNIKRFIDLIHGENGVSPTLEEYGMYAAYSSGLRSACLSRQVGASIMSADGVVIATGRNDVPKPGGGLYGPESGRSDARCIKLEQAKCHNDFYKQQLVDDIKSVITQSLQEHFQKKENPTNLAEEVKLSPADYESLSEKIAYAAQENTRLGGLIEFSRSIHAEMDAIVSLAFKGGGKTEGGSLFTYTFPCHNCARHIVAAGISKVYYLEPYEKSLAVQLHGDAIDVDGQKGISAGQGETIEKVQFIHFEGVAPRQYLNMFTPSGERKDKYGNAIKVSVRDSEKKIPEYLDDYRKYELKVLEHLTTVVSELKSQ